MDSSSPLDDARKVLSSHGHAFQYAVLRRGEELANTRKSTWLFEAAEFPVGQANDVVHIDFVLQSASGRVYLVAECKRADPARARWCFVKAPYTRRDAHETELVFEQIRCRPANAVWSDPRVTYRSSRATHLGIELGTKTKGDGSRTGASIKEATTQVLRALNGLVEHMFPGSASQVKEAGATVFIPVIFTTAELWLAVGNLGDADLTTGQLPENWAQLEQVPWLWYTYNQSRALRHALRPGEDRGAFDLSGALHAEYSRSIAVVGAGGVDAFLTDDPNSWL